MTPHYDWTPASEPPDTDRFVIVWCKTHNRALTAYYASYKVWHSMSDTFDFWRDVSPPDVEEPTCKDGLQVEGQDDEERFTLRQIYNACIAVEIEESKYESLLLELDSLKWKGVEAPQP